MICIECGGTAFNNTELCESCMEMNRSGTMSLDMARQCDISMSCASCQRVVTPDSRQCSNCRKNYHLSCDSSEASTLNGFVCLSCRRRNQILSEDLMLSASAAPSRGQNAPLSPFSDPSVPQISLQVPSVPMTSSYPNNTDFGVDMYSQIRNTSVVQQQQHQKSVKQILATQTQQLMDEISDGGATNDSDRNSSPFYQETSDYDEDFVPASTRGRGRGGGKKKPGRGQSAGTRRVTNPGPSGIFSATQLQAMGDFPQSTTTRGKRGKRGNGTAVPRQSGKGPGRGRGRGRGSAAQAAAVFQQVQYGTAAPMGIHMFHPGSSQMLQLSSSGHQINASSSQLQPNSNPIIPHAAVAPIVMNQNLQNAPVPSAVTHHLDQMSSIAQTFQQTPQPVAVREVDELMLEDENSRNSGGSRSDDIEYTRFAVVSRVNDEFLQKACMCLQCGSIGRGAEGSMIACSNCAQTFHTYCVQLQEKINYAVFSRGWRCLDCTVCEGCGTGGDESKLLLCEECDVSYHMYCINPPLENIPPGPWRCQWCSRCRRCNHKATSGNDLTSGGLCHPCYSLQKCPCCEKGYQINDKIIRCSQCSKWHHGHCEDLYTDEQLEQFAINRMRCTACRPNRVQNNGYFDSDTVLCDNVALDKDAHEILKSKYTPSALKNHILEVVGHRESFDHYDEDYNSLEDSSDQVAHLQLTTNQRGRGRGNPSGRRGMNRIGIGGFYAKLPRHRIQALTEEAAAAALADEEDTKKTKRPRKPRRSQLEDAYPPPIQEAFFGMKAVEGKALIDTAVDEPSLAEFNGRYKKDRPSRAFELCMDASEMLRNDINENEFLDNMDLGNMDTDLNFEDMDFSLLIDEEEYTDDLDDSLQGEMTAKEEVIEGGYGPTTFNLEQQPSTSGDMTNGASGPLDGSQLGPSPANFAQHAPGVRAAMTRSGSQTDAPDRYQFAARWEEDEPLALRATTAAVLYSNEKHGYLKEQFPIWSDRVKQIQKLWRNLSSEDRQDYVNRARDNRTKSGSKPRPRKNNVQSTNSVDSPTTQSPAPHMLGFKVPINPVEHSLSASSTLGSSEQSLQPKQVFITNHLPLTVYQQYQDNKRQKLDRERLHGSLEEQLTKYRKQKKNLAAKKRQMVKTQKTAPDYDGRNIDLSESDQLFFAQLTEQIKSTQAEMEVVRRELKSHENSLREFEIRHAIVRNENEVKPEDIQQSASRDQQYAAHAEQLIAQQAQQQVLEQVVHQGPPPSGAPAPIHLPLLHQQQQQQQRMMQMQGMSMMRPGHFMPRQQPGVAPISFQQQQEFHRRMMMQQMRQSRSVLGGIKYEDITDPVMKDVYECLEAIVFDVHTLLETQRDGQQHPHPQLLQRMMQPSSASGPRLIIPGPPGPVSQLHPGASRQQPPPMAPQLTQPLQISEDGPKPKKKRTVQKKTASSYPATGEYDAWIETMRTRFRLCPEIPKKQREPRLNRPGCEFVSHGMTDMAVVRQRKPLIGEFGAMTVKRGTRIFGNEDCKKKSLIFHDVNLYQVEPNIRLIALYNSSMTTAEDDVFQDEKDRNSEKPASTLQKLLSKKKPSLDHIRTRARYMDEAKAPLAPERSIFFEETEREDDVTVELVFNTCDITQESSETDKKDLCGKLQEQIKDLLDLKEELSWKMEDTPPMSPASCSPEPDTSDVVRKTTSTSRAASASVEKEIKTEEEEEVSATAPAFREIKKEIIESSQNHQCKQCQKIPDPAIAVRVKMEKLGILSPEAISDEKEECVSFCSKKCYYELMSTSRLALTHEELAAAEHHVSEETFGKLKQILSDSIVKAVSLGKKPPVSSFSASSLGSMDILISPRDTRYMMDEGKKDNVAIVPVSSLIGAVEAPKESSSQSTAAAEDWKAYDQGLYSSFKSLEQQKRHYIFSPKIGVPHPPYELDKRLCIFCGGIGDGETPRCGRLIPLTEYYWVHVNCAMWSAEVFEHPSGALTNVDRAALRAAQTSCDHCKRPGASVKCHKMNCGVNYHLLCAMQRNGYFVKDKTFICKQHERVANSVAVYSFEAIRKIYVKRDENALLMRLFDLSDGPNLCLRLGAFTFYKLGSITPNQLKRFHNKDYIFPNNYRVTRFFWSPKNCRERMLFECTIEDRDNQPVFVVKSLEDKTICSHAFSATKAWLPIFEKVKQLREQQGDTLNFFGSQICGEALFGLNESAITKITESLPGFDTIFTYQHRHPNSPVLELPLAENPMGCARAEPRNRVVLQHFRTKPQPMGGTSYHHGVIVSTSSASSQASILSTSQLDTLQSRQASTSVTSANSGRTRGVRSYYTEEAAARARAFGISPDLASLSLRMETTQHAQSTFSAYQKMRREWKDRVYLARSRIAGLGLYAKTDISMGEYIIEYKGEIIRSEVCEVREIRYNVQNRGVYMFRIDEEWVIDATMAGGPARYINHSCDPNCSTQILDAGSGAREKKIIITANRPISSNEELTYDYQFELEGTTDKIPCLCGAPNCVKWMN